MSKDHRLSRALHVLIHMDKIRGHVTSEDIALMINTNPVVVRRLFQGLKQAGIIHSEKGHGGGWILQKPLGDITLLDVFLAIGCTELFSIGWVTEHEKCMIEDAVNTEISDTFAEARRLITDRFAELTLDKLVPKEIKHQ
ncbi:Rrf2 family transcriptional regulator (plasmid) [Providencia rettgeri]|uniref:Rrf2 family transcriptional regulator n=1 Tax=Providencia rettgeri TaxID=587 RepID=UPI001CA6139C|nr:Rrf2 family transcriptional regulator [Providencia rettgeri]QZY66637.1 Rrf2 family transcriptional regulator [Providencia rettgeri]